MVSLASEKETTEYEYSDLSREINPLSSRFDSALGHKILYGSPLRQPGEPGPETELGDNQGFFVIVSDFSLKNPQPGRRSLADLVWPVLDGTSASTPCSAAGGRTSLLVPSRIPSTSPVNWLVAGTCGAWAVPPRCYDVNHAHLGPRGHPPFSTLPSAPLITAAQCHNPLRRYGIHLISLVLLL